jgi:hypothetical protein
MYYSSRGQDAQRGSLTAAIRFDKSRTTCYALHAKAKYVRYACQLHTGLVWVVQLVRILQTTNANACAIAATVSDLFISPGEKQALGTGSNPCARHASKGGMPLAHRLRDVSPFFVAANHYARARREVIQFTKAPATWT